MTYYNPLFAYGIERFVDDAVAAGIDGLIVPDLPPEEAEELGGRLPRRRAGDHLPAGAHQHRTSASALWPSTATGFIYLVSVTGITGARTELPPDLAEFVARVRRHTNLPLAVGFGIGTGAQAAAVAADCRWRDRRLGAGQGRRQPRSGGRSAALGCRTRPRRTPTAYRLNNKDFPEAYTLGKSLSLHNPCTALLSRRSLRRPPADTSPPYRPAP